MRKIAFLILIIMISGSIYSNNFRDTINVVVNQEFKLPRKELADLISPTRGVTYSAKLMDMSKNVIRECKKFIQHPTKENFQKTLPVDGRGSAVALVLYESIDKVGEYIIQVDITATPEVNAVGFSATRLYKIVVGYPNLINPTGMKSSFFYKENKSFNFATKEFADVSLYSHKIEAGGSIIAENKSSYIQLDTILSDKKYIGKEIKITGYYNDKVFEYNELGTDKKEQTEWRFQVLPPKSLTTLYSWSQDADEEILIDPRPDMNRTFYFALTARVGDKMLVVPAERSGSIDVQSDPPEFIENVEEEKQGIWYVIRVVPSEDFINGIETCGSKKVVLSIKYNTIYPGVSINETYYGSVIR